MALMRPLEWAKTYAATIGHQPSLRAQMRRATTDKVNAQAALDAWDDQLSLMRAHMATLGRPVETGPMLEYRALLTQDLHEANEAIQIINAALVDLMREE